MDDLQAKIKAEYEAGAGPKALAEKHDISINTIKSWIKRFKWKRGAPSDEGAPSDVAGVHPEERGVSPPKEELESAGDSDENLDLTPMQRLFVEEYLKDLNATQAAIRAGYSQKTAREQGHRLFTNVHIRAAIDTAMQTRVERVQVDSDWVLKRLVRLADYNVRDFANLQTVKRIFLTKDGEPMEDEVQMVVLNPDFDGSIAKALNQDKDGIKLEMPDRLRALELIGKHIGMFTDPHRARVDKARLQLDRERLEIDRAKAKLDQGGDKVIKVTLPAPPEVKNDAND